MKTKTETVQIDFRGLTLYVVGCYTPPEAAVYYYSDGSGYPGSPSEFDIKEIWWTGINVSEIFETILSMNDWGELEILCINEIE